MCSVMSTYHEAEEKPNFEPFPPPVFLIHILSRSSG